MQTNFKEFMKDCHASLILPENALIIARKVMPKMSEMGCRKCRARAARPFYPQEQTSSACPGMSVWCQRSGLAGKREQDRDPSSEVLGYAGCAISDLGDTSRGVEILQQAVELDPSNAQAQVALGAALALSGDLDGGIARMRHGIKRSPRDRRLAFWGWALGGYLIRAQRPTEALEEPKLAARRDPRLFLPPLLETLAHTALGQTDAAKISLISARRLRPELTLREVEISHGMRFLAPRLLIDQLCFGLLAY